MPELNDLLLFIIAGLTLNITPGPDMMFVITRSVAESTRSGVISSLGIAAGSLFHTFAVALGLAALVKAFPAAFKVVAVLGAVYVAWLGVKALRGAFATAGQPDRLVVRKGRSAFVDGFAVQIANPKAILFFTAVLPPFVDVSRPVAPQMALFAVAVIGMDMMSMSAYALSGAALSRRMQQPRFRKAFGVFVGVLLMTAALLIVARL
ncbi:MAG: LysE family translocator [Proteobacteria bacterium]|nr:LysE family translocator [Pseudomonadota bacterium]